MMAPIAEWDIISCCLNEFFRGFVTEIRIGSCCHMTKISRREALKHIVAGVAFAALPTAITAMPTVSHAAHLPKYRKISGKLSFYNIHTKDSISIKYLARDGNFDFGALTDLEYVFRCHYTGKVHPIDPRAFSAAG